MVFNADTSIFDRATKVAQGDSRFLGLCLHQEANHENEFTDEELVFVCAPLAFGACAEDLRSLAENLGPLLHGYQQDKGDAEREITCLYDEPLRRIDIRLLPLDGVAELHRPKILWEKEGALRAEIGKHRDPNPVLDLQWMEDRFWIWMHGAAEALRAGAVFEALHQMSCLRTRILAPLLLKSHAKPASGLKAIEQTDSESLSSLRATVPLYDAKSCEISLREAAKLYVGLRESLAPDDLVRHQRAEMAVMRNLHAVSDELSPAP
ncbi:MAG: hypothetical protein EOP11_02365 [Proteobacteria bacterium]|nr:MAG: hypothetical protein EOP11_02365 [Pseudomonadota bacterium]